MSIIQIQHLYKTFGTGENAVHALEDISLDIQKGEIFGIIGLSGAGKSTLVRCMNLLEEPTSGHIFFEGTDITDKNTDINLLRRKMGMVFQQFNLYPNMTVLGNLTLAPIKLQKKSKEEANAAAMAALKRVGLAHKAGEYPQNLSGGQQQRVAIARALVSKPAIVLADEPTGNLDSKTSSDVLGLLKTTSRKFHQTLVMITHNNEIAQLADRIVRIEDGRIAL